MVSPGMVLGLQIQAGDRARTDEARVRVMERALFEEQGSISATTPGMDVYNALLADLRAPLEAGEPGDGGEPGEPADTPLADALAQPDLQELSDAEQAAAWFWYHDIDRLLPRPLPLQTGHDRHGGVVLVQVLQPHLAAAEVEVLVYRR